MSGEKVPEVVNLSKNSWRHFFKNLCSPLLSRVRHCIPCALCYPMCATAIPCAPLLSRVRHCISCALCYPVCATAVPCAALQSRIHHRSPLFPTAILCALLLSRVPIDILCLQLCCVLYCYILCAPLLSCVRPSHAMCATATYLLFSSSDWSAKFSNLLFRLDACFTGTK